MAIKYLTNIDLSQNELLRARIENYSGNPQSDSIPGAEGQLIWSSTSDNLFVHNGTSWEPVDTLFSISSEAGVGSAIIRLTGTDGFTDDITIKGDDVISVSRAGSSLINITHGTNDGQLHVPATGIINSGKYLKAGATAGDISWDEINLGTDTTGNYVAGLSAGTGVNITNGSGEATIPIISIGQPVAATDTVTFAGATIGAIVVGTTDDNKITTTSGNLTLGSADSNVYVENNLLVQGNLTVNGTVTTINTETLNLSDNIIVLNSDEAGVPTQNAGFEIERGTSTNTLLIWNESSDRWTFTNDGTIYHNIAIPTEYTYYAGNGIALTDKTFSVLAGDGLVQEADGLAHADTSTLTGVQGSQGIANITVDGFGHITGVTTATYMRRFAATLNTSATEYIVTHNLGSQDVQIVLREVAAPYSQVYTDIEYTTINTATIKFNTAPPAGTYRVIVIG